MKNIPYSQIEKFNTCEDACSPHMVCVCTQHNSNESPTSLICGVPEVESNRLSNICVKKTPEYPKQF